MSACVQFAARYATRVGGSRRYVERTRNSCGAARMKPSEASSCVSGCPAERAPAGVFRGGCASGGVRAPWCGGAPVSSAAKAARHRVASPCMIGATASTASAVGHGSCTSPPPAWCSRRRAGVAAVEAAPKKETSSERRGQSSYQPGRHAASSSAVNAETRVRLARQRLPQPGTSQSPVHTHACTGGGGVLCGAACAWLVTMRSPGWMHGGAPHAHGVGISGVRRRGKRGRRHGLP